MPTFTGNHVIMTEDYEHAIEGILALARWYHEKAIADEDQFFEDIAYDIRRVVWAHLGADV